MNHLPWEMRFVCVHASLKPPILRNTLPFEYFKFRYRRLVLQECWKERAQDGSEARTFIIDCVPLASGAALRRARNRASVWLWLNIKVIIRRIGSPTWSGALGRRFLLFPLEEWNRFLGEFNLSSEFNGRSRIAITGQRRSCKSGAFLLFRISSRHKAKSPT